MNATLTNPKSRPAKSRATKQATPEAVLKALPPLYYDPGQRGYWTQNSRGGWIPVNEVNTKRLLASHHGIPKNLVEETLLRVLHEQDIEYAGPLAGYDEGVREVCANRVLVTKSRARVVPAPGTFPLLQNVLDQLLGPEQIPYFLGWLQVALRALEASEVRPGQALAIAGPRGSGKSLLQDVITELFGNRAAKPYRFMTGRTEFNRELFGAEHLMIEDEAASTDIRSRRALAEQIKGIAANEVHKCHGKHREGIHLRPFWRLSITLNEEPENLLVLPPLDESLEDKVILLKASRATMPMPTGDITQRRQFRDALSAELPAFVYHLLKEWQMPEELVDSRYGVKFFHHPELVAALQTLAPEDELLELIDSVPQLFEDPEGNNVIPARPRVPWRGSAARLEGMLENCESTRHRARRLLYSGTICSAYLGRLVKRYPNRMQRARSADSRDWIIQPPPPSKVPEAEPGWGRGV